MQTFTAIHVVISLIGILSGLVVMFGMLARKPFDRWTVLFLLAIAAARGFHRQDRQSMRRHPIEEGVL